MPRQPLLILFAMLCSTHLPASATPQSACQTPSDEQVRALFDEWNGRLQSADANTVAELYKEDALLLPTLSAMPRLSREAHVAYFEHFLRDRPTGVLTEAQVFSSCNQATLAGLYTFTFAATGEQVPARFTFNYQKVGNKWLITHHHSSLQPSSQDAGN